MLSNYSNQKYHFSHKILRDVLVLLPTGLDMLLIYIYKVKNPTTNILTSHRITNITEIIRIN